MKGVDILTVEQLAKQIFDECIKENEPVSMEDALEMAKMELGAKGIKNYTQSEPTKKTAKKPKVVQVSQEKQMLFNNILGCVNTIYGENVEILTENKLISVQIDGKTFKIDIIEQRKPKK